MDRVAFTRNTLRDFVSHFCFRVADDNIIIRHQKSVGDLSLCRETFARAGGAEDKPIGIFQLFPVHHDKVVGQGVQAIIQAFLTGLIQFLRGERHENRCAGSGQPALDLHLIDADRQRGHQPLFLLEVKTLERTVILLGNGGGLEHRVFELLAIGCRVHNENGHEEQSLIAGLEILQQTLCLTAEGGEVGRE